MINNITNLNNNSIIDAKSLIEFSKSFIFKDKFTADINESNMSLSFSSYYIKACLNQSEQIPIRLPNFIKSQLPYNSTNRDLLELYVKNTYYSIKNNSNEENFFIEQNTYYRKLFIDYYNNTISKNGNLDESYEYNINLLETNDIQIKENILMFIFNARIYNHLDIIYYDNLVNNIQIDKFLSNYSVNKTYFLKTIYTEGFEIQENYFNFCKFFIVFMTIQQYISNKTEIVFDVDLLDEYSIKNFLYSYGIYFLDDLPTYSQRRVIKNIQRLLNNKGNNQVIANILDIFELHDNIVFKYYMEKKYDNNTVNDVEFVGIPYNQYSYLKYIDSNSEKNIKPYNYFSSSDKSWKTAKDYILEPTNNVDFDYIETKYLSVESSFEIQTFASECAFFFDTIYRSKEYTNNIFTTSKIKTNYSTNGFDIFEGMIALSTLAMLINGSEPIIFKSNSMNNRNSFLDNTDSLELTKATIGTGINLSRYYTIDTIKVEVLDNMVTKINSNLNFRKDFESIIVNVDNYNDYIELKEDYYKLFHANSNRVYFTSYDNYLDYLKQVNLDLYNFILPVYKTKIEVDLLKKFNTLVQDLKDYLNLNTLIWDIPYRETIIKYLYYTIDYFKSYTIQLTDLKIMFRFNNELENKLFLLDKGNNGLNYIVINKIADLVGGELYELQEHPLSLSDNFYNNGYKYRNIGNTLLIKDSLKTKITDSFKLNIIY